MHTVSMGVIESAFERRRQQSPKENPDIAFRAVCRELGIAGNRVIKSLRKVFIEERSTLLIGRWQARRSTTKPVQESWLDRWEREHDK